MFKLTTEQRVLIDVIKRDGVPFLLGAIVLTMNFVISMSTSATILLLFAGGVYGMACVFAGVHLVNPFNPRIYVPVTLVVAGIGIGHAAFLVEGSVLSWNQFLHAWSFALLMSGVTAYMFVRAMNRLPAAQVRAMHSR